MTTFDIMPNPRELLGDYSRVLDKKIVLNDKGELTSTAGGVIWYCLILGMPDITTENLVEFYTRMTMYDKVTGGLLLKKDDLSHYTIPLEVLCMFIGLQTRANKKTRNKFLTDMYHNIFYECASEIRALRYSIMGADNANQN